MIPVAPGGLCWGAAHLTPAGMATRAGMLLSWGHDRPGESRVHKVDHHPTRVTTEHRKVPTEAGS
jgi:hypothetical protein